MSHSTLASAQDVSITSPDPERVTAATQQLDAALTTLTFSRLRFDLLLTEPMILPRFYGSMLRGGLGIYFKRLVCVQPQINQCRDCPLLHQCAYPYVFETPLPPQLPSAPHLQEVSPYILVPVTPPGNYPAGSMLTFNLLLFGKAVGYLPYFIISYRQLGQQAGLGRDRTRFELATVIDETPGIIPHTLYAQVSGSVNMQPQPRSLQACLPTLPNVLSTIHLDFETPTRIKTKNKVTSAPTFHEIVAALLRRFSQLILVHGSDQTNTPGAQWMVDEAILLAGAAQVETTYSQLHLEKWDRFSGRQAQSIRMGGVVGSIGFTGELRPFLPLLWAGQFLHVGRGTTFGNGQYAIRL